jgi:hypothetical protein
MVKINSEKDLQIDVMKIKLKKTTTKYQRGHFLQTYNEVLSESQITRLESVDEAPKHDSTFIRLIIAFLYSQEESIPTLKIGIKHDRPKLPDEILDIIKAMFSLRLQMCCNNDDNFALRYKKTNTHISNGLNSLFQKKRSEIINNNHILNV